MSGQIYAFSADRALDRIMPGTNIHRGYGIFAMFVFVKIFELGFSTNCAAAPHDRSLTHTCDTTQRGK